jgi:pimeloyl-ACP methyl ester carboxylesterase
MDSLAGAPTRSTMTLALASANIAPLFGCHAVREGDAFLARKHVRWNGLGKRLSSRAPSILVTYSPWPAVFLPGGVRPAELSWAALSREAGGGRTVLLKDHEVFASDEPPAGWGYALEAQGLLRAVDRVGATRFHGVGYSLGAEVLLSFAVAHPTRVGSLVLVEPGLGSEFVTEAEKDARARFESATSFQDAFAAQAELLVRPGVKAEVPGRPAEHEPPWMASRRRAFPLFQRLMRSTLEKTALRAVRAPVVLALGSGSSDMLARNARSLAAAFQDARVDVYEGANHFFPPHVQDPKRFVGTLLDTWARAEARA